MKTNIENKWVQKLIADLAKEDIIFYEDQDETEIFGYNGKILGKRKLENIVLQRGDKSIKISKDIFFRISGLSTIIDKVGKNEFYKEIKVTDEMFYQMQKMLILSSFNGIYE